MTRPSIPLNIRKPTKQDKQAVTQFRRERRALGHGVVAFHAECRCGFKTDDDNAWSDHEFELCYQVLKRRGEKQKRDAVAANLNFMVRST